MMLRFRQCVDPKGEFEESVLMTEGDGNANRGGDQGNGDCVLATIRRFPMMDAVSGVFGEHPAM